MQKKFHIARVLGLGLFMETLDSTVLNTALPQMASSFEADILTLKLAIISYFITFAAFLPIGGYLTDRWGTKRVFFTAVMVFILSSFGCGMAQNLTELVIGRLLQGMSGAMITPVGRLILLKTFGRKEYITAFTSLVLIGQMGVALGPTLGGFLTTFFGWRWIFFINVPVGLFLLGLVARYIPNHREEITYRLDKAGFLLFASALSAITFGLAWMTEQAFQDDLFAVSLMLTGMLLLGLYVWHAQHCHKPLLNFSLLRLHTFRISLAGNFISRLPLNAPFFLLTLLLQVELDFSAFKAGLFLIPYGVGMVLAKPMFRHAIYRYGFRRCLTVNPIILALILFSFSQVNQATSMWVICLLIGLLGFFTSCQFSSMNTLAFSDIDSNEMSPATIITSVSQQLATSTAICCAAGLLIMVGHYCGVNPLSLASFHVTFMILGGIMLSSILIFRRLSLKDGEAML